MANQKSGLNRTFILAIGILLLLLVGFPIGSWFYLKAGLDYRKEVMSDLHDYGAMPSIALTTYSGQTLEKQDVAEKIIVAAFLNFQDQTITEQSGRWLFKLHDQFDERRDVAFLLHVMDTTASPENIDAFATEYQLQDTAQCFFLKENPEIFKTIATNVYKIPENAVNAHFALADAQGTVRRYYDLRKTEEVNRLVEHIALLLPMEKGRSVSGKSDN
ncbi:MAG: hypothetical protein IPJ74_06690 [Saprospiraceae bacterium]|nr:hypothetical protein [Saprospiraceae bacterium]